jgi:hypothetical protein
MNERILELAKQAGHRYYPSSNSGPLRVEYLTPELEKFAELIVREYEKLLPEICPWADAGKEGPMKGWHVQFVARKHFGVEE